VNNTSESLADPRQRVGELEAEAEALDHLANVGEVAGVVAHEFSDFLNMLLLHVAVLEFRLPEAERADLAEVRRHGNRATELIGRFQQYRRSSPRSERVTDLAAVTRDVVSRLEHEAAEALNGVRVRVNASASPVRGAAPELRRLARFLIQNAARTSAAGGHEVIVTIEPGRLVVEDSGPSASENDIGHLFSPTSTRQGVDPLEMTACRSLVRRLRGQLTAEARTEGGVRVVVEFED